MKRWGNTDKADHPYGKHYIKTPAPSDEYRDGWERIWGRKQFVREVPEKALDEAWARLQSQNESSTRPEEKHTWTEKG